MLPTAAFAAVDPAAVDPAAIDPAAADPADPSAAAAAVSFDDGFISAEGGRKIDLSRFEKSGIVGPGTYHGDVLVNEQWRARTDLVFVSIAGKESAQPCFDAATLRTYGVDLRKVAEHGMPGHLPSRPIPATGRFCGPIGDYIPGATAQFDTGEQSLSLSVPQIYMSRDARGYVDPSQWDAGINAGVFNYNTNVYRSDNAGRAQSSAYIGINAALDLGSWHLVHMGSASWTEQNGASYQNSATYLQHDIPAWQAQAQAGDVYTAGDIFDSVRLRGARLYTDQRMLPQSEQGYAPVIRGVARTNAKVQVKQHGYIIYETTVAPGPFVIDDLYPTGYGGDLDIEVQEADGRIERSTVPYAAVPQLLRPGQGFWEVDIGKISQTGTGDTPFMAQATYRRGLTNNVTAYGGAEFATSYHALLAGAAFNTPIGALSADVTQSQNKVPGQQGTTGLSLRVAYSKNIAESGTNFGLAAYRYSTGGFVSLNDAVYMRTAVEQGLGSNVVARPRSRIDVNINQTLSDRFGSVYLTGSASDYWNQSGRQVSFTAGYSNQWKSLSYSFSAQRTRNSLVDNSPLAGIAPIDNIPGAPIIPSALNFNTRVETTLWLTLSMPLGTADRAPYFTGSTSHTEAGGMSNQVAVSGRLGSNNRYNYNATLSRNDGSGTSGSLYGQYAGSKSNLSAGYSHGGGYNQVSASASGSIVAHSGGITFAPPTGDTIGLVDAPDATGARVQGSNGSTVDSNGYAVMTNLMPYQLNTVGLDPKNASAGLELESTTQNVAPRAGSVVRLKYKTSIGRALLIDTQLSDGSPIPFGAEVLDEAGNNVGVTGQASRLFVRGLKQSGSLTVRWGDQADESCRIDVTLPPLGKGKGIQKNYENFKLPCTQGAALPSAVSTFPGSAAQQQAAKNEQARVGKGIVNAVTASGLGLARPDLSAVTGANP